MGRGDPLGAMRGGQMTSQRHSDKTIDGPGGEGDGESKSTILVQGPYCRACRYGFFSRHYVEDGHGTWPQPGDDSVMTPPVLPVRPCNEGTVLWLRGVKHGSEVNRT